MASGVPRKKKALKAAIDLLKRKEINAWPNTPENPECFSTVFSGIPLGGDPITGLVPLQSVSNAMETCLTYYYYHLNGNQWNCIDDLGLDLPGGWAPAPQCSGVDVGQLTPYIYAIQDAVNVKATKDQSSNAYSFRNKESIPRKEKLSFFKSFADPIMKGETPWPEWLDAARRWTVAHYTLGGLKSTGILLGNTYINTASLAEGAHDAPYAYDVNNVQFNNKRKFKGRGVIYTNEGPLTSYIPCLHTVPGVTSMQIPKHWTGSIAYPLGGIESATYQTHTQSLILGVYGSIGKGDTLNIYAGGAEGFDHLVGTFGPSDHYLAGAEFWPGGQYGPPETYNYYRKFFVIPTGSLPIQIALTQSATDTNAKAGLMICWAGYDKTSL